MEGLFVRPRAGHRDSKMHKTKLALLDCKFPEVKDYGCLVHHYICHAWDSAWHVVGAQYIFWVNKRLTKAPRRSQ